MKIEGADRVSHRGIRVTGIPLVCAAVMLTACTPTGPVTRDASLDRLQTQLSADYSALIDPGGLIVNPTRTRVEPLDIYGSALLIDARSAGGDSLTDVHPSELTMSAVDDYRDVARTPDEWIAASLAILTLRTGRPTPVRVEVSEPPPVDDPHDESATVHNIALQAAAGAEVDRDAIRARIETLLRAADGGVLVAWRTEEACRLLHTPCRWSNRLSIVPDLESIEGILELRAAAELTADGEAVAGWAPADFVDDARAALNQLRDGEDLLAANLARIIAVAGGGSAALDDYLRRAQPRRDPETGLYRRVVHDQGTIAGTYEAMLTLGDHFSDLVNDPDRPEGADTRALLRRLLTDGTELSPGDRARALAIVDDLDGIDGPLQAQIDDLVRTYAHAPLRHRGAAEAVDVLEALDRLGVDLGDVVVEPWPLTEADERTTNRVIAMAQDGAFANPAAVLSAYARHLDQLVTATIALPDDSSLLLSRLALISNQPPEDLSVDDELALRARLESRRGGATSSVMYRVSDDADAPCELRTTREAVQSGFAL